MCQHGVVSTVFSGKHCNRCQTVHKTFIIAIERWYVHKTCTIDVRVSLTMKNLVRLDLLNSWKSNSDYQSIKDNVLAGRFVKTAQSWSQYCNIALCNQHRWLWLETSVLGSAITILFCFNFFTSTLIFIIQLLLVSKKTKRCSYFLLIFKHEICLNSHISY